MTSSQLPASGRTHSGTRLARPHRPVTLYSSVYGVWAAVFALLVSYLAVGLSLLLAVLLAGLAAAVVGLVVPVGIAVRGGQARSR
jgi:uncharacterized membrane protein